MKLLLVEDMLAYARALRALLRGIDDADFHLHHVETLAEALAALGSDHWDCVLLDLHLPDGEGIECVERLRNQDPRTAIVVLTGFDDRELALEALRRGAQEYAIKGEHPPEELLRIIRHAIERNRVVNALNEQRAREVEAAHHDPVTGLPNRLLLSERARSVLGAADRDHSRAALLYFDLDGFKSINDRHGHDAGDLALAAVAQLLRQSIRDPDVAARVGGDEFVVLLASINDAAEAERAAFRIIRRIGELRAVGPFTVALGASSGVALFPAHGRGFEELLGRADSAMYTAKRAGKNTVRIFGAPDGLQITSANADDGNFTLSFQPWIRVEGEGIGGIETLLSSPDTGESAPDLLRASERRGEIDALGRWVLRRAAMQWLEWRREGFDPARLAINLAAAELRERRFAISRLGLLAELGVPPHAFQVEIAEDTLLLADVAALDALGELQSAGVHVIADNVGRTQAALARLVQIPLDGLKLDLSLMSGLRRKDRAAYAVAAGVLAAAGALGVECCAVGVENAADLAACRDLGFTFVQGYWLGRPRPGAACIAL